MTKTDRETRYEYQRQYREKNKERLAAQRKEFRDSNKEKIFQQKAAYREKYKSQITQKKIEYYQKNKDTIKLRNSRSNKSDHELAKLRAISNERYQKNKDSILKRERERRKLAGKVDITNKKKYLIKRRAEDPVFSMIGRVRCRIYSAFREKGLSKRSKTMQMIGCDWKELHAHIESLFSEGMTWGNRSEWHIDHKTPLAQAKTVEEVELLCHYTNLQPLWAADNLRKHAKIQ